MSRSGYNDWDCEGDANLYRANIDRALAGRRGQAMLKALLEALDTMPEKRLVVGEFSGGGGQVCAFGALGKARGLDMTKWDDAAVQGDDEFLAQEIAKAFDIPQMLAREVMYENDEGSPYWGKETLEQRWERMRRWVVSNIR